MDIFMPSAGFLESVFTYIGSMGREKRTINGHDQSKWQAGRNASNSYAL